MFGSLTFQVTPEFLSLYSLDWDTYEAYFVATNYNVPGLVRMEGTEFDYKQVLTFLPQWARAVQIFANMTAQRAVGDVTASFSNYQPRVYNWGASLTRPKYDVRMNWNYRGPHRTHRDVGAQHRAGLLQLDRAGPLHRPQGANTISALASASSSVSGIWVTPLETSSALAPKTPDYAKTFLRYDYAQLWTVGVKGSF